MTITSPEAEFFQHVVDKDLVEALDRLPVPLRETVLLAGLEECAYMGIARISGCPSEPSCPGSFEGARVSEGS
jgi:DNA-directed RNA polymerase specialized sigma24 family protein